MRFDLFGTGACACILYESAALRRRQAHAPIQLTD